MLFRSIETKTEEDELAGKLELTTLELTTLDETTKLELETMLELELDDPQPSRALHVSIAPVPIFPVRVGL